MDDNFIRKRISELRIDKEMSERKLSLSLGHSASYIQSITSGKSLPSMTEFLYLCHYLGISPKDFFDDGVKNPHLINAIIEDLNALDENQISNIHAIIKAMKK